MPIQLKQTITIGSVMNLENKSDILYRRLRQRIHGMREGEMFPPIRQLMAEYQVSQATVVIAINQLKEQGLLESFVGRGTFLRQRNSSQPKFLLLYPYWPSLALTSNAMAILAAAREAGFEAAELVYPHTEDITLKLAELEADIIVIDSISNNTLSHEQARRIYDSPIPVLLSRFEIPLQGIHYVGHNLNNSGSLAAGYLHRMGHRKLGLLFNEPHTQKSESRAQSFLGMAQAQGCGVEVIDLRIERGEHFEPKIPWVARDIADGRYDFSALFVISQAGATLLQEELTKLKLTVPDDLSIVAFGNTPAHPFLTTVGHNVNRYARKVVETARTILQGTEHEQQHTLPLELYERHSVKNLNPTK